MTSIELLEYITLFLTKSSDAVPVIKMLSDLSDWADKVTAAALLTVEVQHDPDKTQRNDEARKINRQAQLAWRKFKPSQVNDELNGVLLFCEMTLKKLGPRGAAIQEGYLARKQIFIEAVDQVSVDGGIHEENMNRILVAAKSLHAALSEQRRILLAVAEAITPQPVAIDGYGEVSIELRGDFTFTEIGEKLIAFEGYYKWVCGLYDVPPESSPLRVVKVETGSIRWIAAGLGMVVTPITDAIIRLSQEWDRAWSATARDRQRVDLIQHAATVNLQIAAQAREAGYSNAAIDNNTAQGIEAATHFIATFISGESININGEDVTLPIAPRALPSLTTNAVVARPPQFVGPQSS